MAEAEAHGDEAEKEGGKPKKGGSPMLLVLLLVNTLGLLGIGAYVVFLMPKGGAPAMTPEQMAAQAGSRDAHASDKGDEDEHPEPKEAGGPTMELGDMVVNLREPGGEHFLKARLTLELSSEDVRPEVEGRISQIRYQVNMLLSGQRMADVQGPEKMEALRQAMLRHIAGVVGKGRVVGVWPEVWIVQ